MSLLNLFRTSELKTPSSGFQKQCAFTLAEVLITLGIIGVIASMTIPNLISEYKKSVIETKLEKFYSTINQAIKLSEVENGDKKAWTSFGATSASTLTWYNKYLADYLKPLKVDSTSSSTVLIIYFLDGSAVAFNSNGWSFLPDAKDIPEYLSNSKPMYGKKLFSFGYWPASTTTSFQNHYDKGVEPYKYSWNQTYASLKTHTEFGCKETVNQFRGYCTAIIQMNGWKIPDDYPFNF